MLDANVLYWAQCWALLTNNGRYRTFSDEKKWELFLERGEGLYCSQTPWSQEEPLFSQQVPEETNRGLYVSEEVSKVKHLNLK